METLDQMPKPQPRTKGSLDWDTILSGQVHLLHRGRDFVHARDTIRTYAYEHATRLGGHARVSLPSDSDTAIYIQFHQGPRQRQVPRNSNSRRRDAATAAT